MLYIVNRENSLNLAEELSLKGQKKVLMTGTENLYAKSIKNGSFFKVILGNSLSIIPNKSFGLAFVEQFVVTNDINLMKIAQVVNGGVIFPYTLPWSLEKFIEKVEFAQETLRPSIRKEWLLIKSRRKR